MSVFKVIKNNMWYNLRPVLGHFNWAMVAALLGGRETGKSYAVMNYFVDTFINKGVPFTWLRLTEKQIQKLLENNAEMLVDADIRRHYNLDLVTSGSNVYHVTKRSEPDAEGHTKVLEKKLMCRCFALSNFYNQKGSGVFDKDFLSDLNMQYHICLDEFCKEANEKRQGNILYQFVNQMENIIRSTKSRTKVFIIANMLESCSDIMIGLNFIPHEFGIYKIKKKRTVIHYMQPSDAYLNRRKGSFADLWMPDASNFTNIISTDTSLLYTGRLRKPRYIIKFTREKCNWYTVWDNGIINIYKNENCPVIAMRAYLDELFNTKQRDAVIEQFDSRSFLFKNLLVAKRFQKDLEILKPRK